MANTWNTMKPVATVQVKFRKNVDYWKKNMVHPYSPHWEKPFKRWKKNWNLYFAPFFNWHEISFSTIFARFRHLNMDFTWHLKIFKTFWPWIYEFCLQLKTLICTEFVSRLWESIYAICKSFWPWIPCLQRARSILEPVFVLHRIWSAVFRAICNILPGVSYRIYFSLVRVYLGITFCWFRVFCQVGLAAYVFNCFTF